jgi:hypothetical protein
MRLRSEFRDAAPSNGDSPRSDTLPLLATPNCGVLPVGFFALSSPAEVSAFMKPPDPHQTYTFHDASASMATFYHLLASIIHSVHRPIPCARRLPKMCRL